jgi:hypothetical protein
LLRLLISTPMSEAIQERLRERGAAWERFDNLLDKQASD